MKTRIRIYYWLVDSWYEIKSWREKFKRLIWNRGIKLHWSRLWIRKDEFHNSLDMDVEAILNMNEKQREAYFKDLGKRRQIAHERDFKEGF